MDLDSLLNALKSNGFNIEYLFKDEKYFGNIHIKARMQNGLLLSIILDRGYWECGILKPSRFDIQKIIPIFVIVNMKNNSDYYVHDTCFNSAEEMLDYIINNKDLLHSIDKKQIKKMYRIWVRKLITTNMMKFKNWK
ncbi:MAG: hypothetical protein AAGU14_04140 [Eubacteriaceae bacterium]